VGAHLASERALSLASDQLKAQKDHERHAHNPTQECAGHVDAQGDAEGAREQPRHVEERRGRRREREEQQRRPPGWRSWPCTQR